MNLKYRLCFLVIFSVMTLTQTSAQTTTKPGTLNDISFLNGRWKGTYNGGPIEASWTAPEGNNIV